MINYYGQNDISKYDKAARRTLYVPFSFWDSILVTEYLCVICIRIILTFCMYCRK